MLAARCRFVLRHGCIINPRLCNVNNPGRCFFQKDEKKPPRWAVLVVDGGGYGLDSLFFWAMATGDVVGTRADDPHALHVLWRELTRHRLYTRPGTMNASQSTSSISMLPFVVVVVSPSWPHAVQYIGAVFGLLPRKIFHSTQSTNPKITHDKTEKPFIFHPSKIMYWRGLLWLFPRCEWQHAGWAWRAGGVLVSGVLGRLWCRWRGLVAQAHLAGALRWPTGLVAWSP